MRKSGWVTLGIWLGVLVLGANAWFSYRILNEVTTEDEAGRPTEVVVVDWSEAAPVRVDVANVSNGVGDGVTSGYVPVVAGWIEGESDEDPEFVDLPVRVQNSIGIKGPIGIEGSGPWGIVEVEVTNWP